MSHPVPNVDRVRLDKALLDLAAEQRSCVAVWQLRDLGASWTEVSRLRTSSRWEPFNRDVLVVPGAVRDELMRASAGVLAAGPGAVLSHSAGTALWGLSGYTMLPTACSQVSGHATRRQQLGYVHDLVVVPERWVTTFKGIRVVRPELAAYQLCGVVHPLKAARTFDAFAVRGLLTSRSAKACLDDLAQRGRNGTAVYRDIIKARGPDYVRPASNVESRMNDLADQAGIVLRRQVNLGGEEFDGRVDFIEDEVKLVVEVQSELYHWALVDREADAARRQRLEDDGFHFLEVWDTDIWTRGTWVVGVLRKAVRDAEVNSHSGLHRTV